MFFSSCDEIWHAGDIGDLSIYNKLMQLKPVRAVVGNIDGYPLRQMLPLVQLFEVEKVKVLLTHICLLYTSDAADDGTLV